MTLPLAVIVTVWGASFSVHQCNYTTVARTHQIRLSSFYNPPPHHVQSPPPPGTTVPPIPRGGGGGAATTQH